MSTIKDQLLEQNRQWLRTADWSQDTQADPAAIILDTYCHCFASAIVGAITFSNRPSPERIEQLKAQTYWRLHEQAHELMGKLAREEGSHN